MESIRIQSFVSAPPEAVWQQLLGRPDVVLDALPDAPERGLWENEVVLPDRALLEAVASGSERFFLGTDSAPHARRAKEAACGCAGIFSAHAGIELYAEAFEAAGALERLEGFAALHGADFYRLPRNAGSITLAREPWEVPDHYPFGADQLVPLRAGERIAWRLAAAARPAP